MSPDFLPEENVLTPLILDKLLSWLDSDRTHAEEKYNHIRSMLSEFFESAGWENVVSLTDQTIIRVAQSIHRIDAASSKDISIFQQAAQKVLKSHLKSWALTKEALDRLLKWLDPDPGQAGEKYRRIHLTLTKIFTSHGFADAESMADEAIKRVIRRLPEIESGYDGNPALYFSGVAKKMCQEYTRLNESSRNTYKEYSRFIELVTPLFKTVEEQDLSQERECFHLCLKRLKSGDRELLLAYYEDEKSEKIRNRKELAKNFGITAGNLRVRRFRAYNSLVECIEECLKKMNNDTHLLPDTDA